MGGILGRAEYKVEGGKLIRINLTIENGKIEHIKITGDFFLHPEDVIEDIERALRGRPLDEDELNRLIENLLENKQAIPIGVSPRDFVRCIMMASEKND